MEADGLENSKLVNVNRLLDTFDAAGILFLEPDVDAGPGVRLRR